MNRTGLFKSWSFKATSATATIAVTVLGTVTFAAGFLVGATAFDDADTEVASVSALADQTGCRAYSLDMAVAQPDAALVEVAEAIGYATEFTGKNGFTSEAFYDWLPDGANVKASIAASSAAAKTSGISDDLFALFRDSAKSLTDLRHAAEIADLGAASTQIESFRATQADITKACA